MSIILEVKNLIKKYGDFEAVNDISFTVEKQSLFAFLGPNGAGKSTTINIIATLLEKTSGDILVNGYHVGTEDQMVRKNIGIVFQNSMLDELLTVRENIVLRAALYKISRKECEKRLEEIHGYIGLNDILDRPYGKLSGGQKRKSDIARALIHYPTILFLDEPTTGLDPKTRIQVWKTIKKLQIEKQITIFLTTHYMEEAAGADKVVIINKGRIVGEGSPSQLKDDYSIDTVNVTPYNLDDFVQHLKADNITFEVIADQVIVPVKDSAEALVFLNKVEGKIESFEVLKGNMDDVFLNITGEALIGEGGR